MKKVLSIDLGGTKIAVGVVDSSGKVISRKMAPTPRGDAEQVVSCIAELSDEVLSSEYTEGNIGLALPGIVDPENGTLIRSPSSGWVDVPFTAMIQEKLGMPVVVENDVRACAWAEYHFGAGTHLRSFFWMTISTGIGGAFLSEGRFAGGRMAGEIGHLVVQPEGFLCGCGNKGCLEAEAAGPAWRRKALRLLEQEEFQGKSVLSTIPPKEIDARRIAEGARKGDALCQTVVGDVSKMLARGLGAIFNILDPDAVFLGGGVAKSFDLIEPLIHPALQNLVLAAKDRTLRILPSSPGYDAALIGAASLVLFPYKS